MGGINLQTSEEGDLSDRRRLIVYEFFVLPQIKFTAFRVIAVISAAKPDHMWTTEGVFHMAFP
jgi:hypothetical protein